MKNVIVLYKNEEGDIMCQSITPEGFKMSESLEEDQGYWHEAGKIELDEIEGILDQEIS